MSIEERKGYWRLVNEKTLDEMQLEYKEGYSEIVLWAREPV